MSSYVINNTNGDVLTTVVPGTTNTNYGLTLIGQNFTSGDNRSWGEIQNENFIRLLENFASDSQPGVSSNSGFVAIPGQLWWDTGSQRLMIYNGAEFIPASEQTVSSTAPTIFKLGDQWFDTTAQQFKVYNGSSWQVIGPGYTAQQGKSGSIVESIVDLTGGSHTVVNTYTNNNLISITSYDVPFTPNITLFPAAATFSTVQPGVNLANTVLLQGTANNSVRVGGLFANSLARSDISTTFARDISVVGNVVLTDANISFINKSLVFQNKNFNGGVQFYINSSSGNIAPLSIDGTTGLATVFGHPTTNLGVATKLYADNIETRTNNNLVANVATLTTSINQLNNNITANINSLAASTTANLSAVQTSINANVTALSSLVDSQISVATANSATQQSSINSINAQLPLLAPKASPVFTGTPQAPTASLNDNSTTIATTEYVDRKATELTNDYTSKFATEATTRNNAITSAVAPLAPITSPVFTGAPAAPTPSAGDNSTRLATTGFVTQAITAQKFNYTVSSGPPSGGSDGDFWFQVG